jgi:hypothetical protein
MSARSGGVAIAARSETKSNGAQAPAGQAAITKELVEIVSGAEAL